MSARRKFLKGLGVGSAWWLSGLARAGDPRVEEAGAAGDAPDAMAAGAEGAGLPMAAEEANAAPLQPEGESPTATQVADAQVLDPMVEESDAAATAVEYVSDASRVDASRHPGFRPDQNCASCAVYTGAGGDAAGGCVLFPHKRVTAQGWCTAWSGDS